MKIWTLIAGKLGQFLTIPVTFRQHYEMWMAISWKNRLSKKLWASTFFTVAWRIWLTRNEIIFQQQDFNQEVLCQNIKRRVAFWTKAWKDHIPYIEEELARNFANIPVILQ